MPPTTTGTVALGIPTPPACFSAGALPAPPSRPASCGWGNRRGGGGGWTAGQPRMAGPQGPVVHFTHALPLPSPPPPPALPPPLYLCPRSSSPAAACHAHPRALRRRPTAAPAGGGTVPVVTAAAGPPSHCAPPASRGRSRRHSPATHTSTPSPSRPPTRRGRRSRWRRWLRPAAVRCTRCHRRRRHCRWGGPRPAVCLSGPLPQRGAETNKPYIPTEHGQQKNEKENTSHAA